MFYLDTAKMLELLSVQRHDFLNHLQIISGLLQLNREAEAREYIRNVVREIVDLSKIVHLAVPEVAAVLLWAHNRAASHQIEFVFDVQTNLIGCTEPGDQLAARLEDIFNNIIDYLAPPEIAHRKVTIGITGNEGNHVWQISFNAVPNAHPGRIKESVRRAGLKLELNIADCNNDIL